MLETKKNAPTMNITTTPVATFALATYRTDLTRFVDWRREMNGRCR